MYQTSHSRWNAISQRDPAAHCSFLYGVKSTKIYCRPTCTARLARRANVIYYDTIEQAQRDGFRACRRCKPDDLAFVGQREETVLSVLELLRTRKDDVAMKWSLKELAREVGVTPSYLCRVFKKTMGTTVGEYMKQFNMDKSQGATKSVYSSPATAESDSACSGMQSAWEATTPTCLSDRESYVRCPDGLEPVAVSMDFVDLGSTSSRLPKPKECWSASAIDPVFHHQTCSEESLDMNFDFDEWVWTEGFNFNDWISTPELSSDDMPA